MTKNSTEEVPLGVVAQEIWGIVMELDRDGRRLLKDDAKNKKQGEKEKMKKAKAKAKKRAKKEQKRKKHEDRKKSKMAVSDSSDKSSSYSDSSDPSSSDSSSNSSSDSNASSDGEKRTRPRDSGGCDGTMKPRRGPRRFRIPVDQQPKALSHQQGDVARLHQFTLPTMQVRWQPPLGFPECRVRLPLRWPSRPPRPMGRGGSLADQGTSKRDKQVVRIRTALGALLEEVEYEVGSSYEATVWR